MNGTFKVGELYRNSDMAGNGWCRHGLVMIYENGYGGSPIACDTYWGPHSPDGYRIDPAQIQKHLEFVIDTTECRNVERDDFEIYADADRAYIPIGGNSERCLVRKDAKPDLSRQREWLERKIREKKADANLASRHAAWLQEQLDALPALEQTA
jgi:hypothetical protein